MNPAARRCVRRTANGQANGKGTIMTFRDYCDGVSRRDFLKAGTLGFLGLNLPAYLSYAQEAATQGKTADKNAILIFLGGGQTHLDTWDPKPDAPEGIRGEF